MFKEGDQYTDTECLDSEAVTENYNEEEEDEEFQKIRKEHVFNPIDYTKRKTSIACTLGYFFLLISQTQNF